MPCTLSVTSLHQSHARDCVTEKWMTRVGQSRLYTVFVAGESPVIYGHRRCICTVLAKSMNDPHVTCAARMVQPVPCIRVRTTCVMHARLECCAVVVGIAGATTHGQCLHGHYAVPCPSLYPEALSLNPESFAGHARICFSDLEWL